MAGFGLFRPGETVAAVTAKNDDFLARYHFVGSDTLGKNDNAAKLKELWSLPISREFGQKIAQKLAREIAEVHREPVDGNAMNSAELLRPLLEDLFKAESMGELRGRSNSKPEFVLNIQLDDQRSQVWQTNLWKVLNSWKAGTLSSLPQAGGVGWEFKNSEIAVRLLRSGSWLTMSVTRPAATWPALFIDQIRKDGRPAPLLQTNWLEFDIDWPRLQPWVPATLPFKLARTRLGLGSRSDGYMRTIMQIVYPERVNWSFEPWRLPLQLMRDPMIGFTAVQALSPFMKTNLPVVGQLGMNPLTNQLYFWAQSDVPFQSFVAQPARNATNVLRKLALTLPFLLNSELKQKNSGEILWLTNKNEITWLGLPIIVPYLGATNDGPVPFLFGGLFPNSKSTNPPPAELFAQIADRKNLIYYDWEITQERIGYWQVLRSLLPFFPGHSQSNTNMTALKSQTQSNTNVTAFKSQRSPLFFEDKWLSAVAPFLGNTITEITFVAPNQLSLVRKSHLGLTGLELVMLAHWLNDSKFPFGPLTSAASAPNH